jgi:hypothetical protein
MNESIQLMQNPRKWPMFPFLPLKRNSSEELGILLAFDTKIIVYLINLSNIPPSLEKLKESPQLKYDSYLHLWDDNWRID